MVRRHDEGSRLRDSAKASDSQDEERSKLTRSVKKIARPCALTSSWLEYTAFFFEYGYRTGDKRWKSE